jgi:serine/threonine-protein kinase
VPSIFSSPDVANAERSADTATASPSEHWWPEASSAALGKLPAPAADANRVVQGGSLSGVTSIVRRTVAWRPARRAGKRPSAGFDYNAIDITLAGLVLLGLVAIVVVATRLLAGGPGGPSGLVTVTSKPPGAQFLLNGEPRGVTPATLRVPAGLHVLEIRSSGPAQVMALRLEEGGEVARFFDLPVGTAAATLRVDTTPPGARVLVDGRPRGRSPLTVSGLNPGPHTVRIERSPHWVERGVTLEAGARAVLAVPLDAPKAGPSEGHGWLTLSAPVELRVSANGREVGTTRAGPLQLPAGRHELEFANDLLGVRVTQSVGIINRRTTAVDLEIPPGELSITATPSAHITIDGESAGAAPIVKRRLNAGQHDIVADHPQLGERRMIVTLAAGAPLALAIDFGR